jgi:hypothetical protein
MRYTTVSKREQGKTVQEHEHVVNTTGTHHVWLGHVMSLLMNRL